MEEISAETAGQRFGSFFLTKHSNKMKTIVLNTQNVGNDIQHMTSLEIAELTGKQHKNVMQAIRNMEPAWKKVTGLNFQLCEKYYPMTNSLSMWAEISAHITSQRVCPPVRL